MEFTERFRWGWCPTSGKKADLMFAQHMLAVCKDRGLVATVMPHGVLFRGGAEKEIRKKILEQDLVEAVIGLPPNLFYGAGIPACILVLRPNLTGQFPNPNKPAARRGQVLFINADAEFHAGRAQNYLRPEHVEKIVSTFDRYEDVPAYARVVPFAEIASAANDFNLNIRRYVDNSPPPEPHDVRAHLLGGVPTAELEARRPHFDALGFDPARAFTPRPGDSRYHDFAPALPDRAAIRQLVENDPGVQARLAAVRQQLTAWWAEHSPRLADLPQRRDLNRVRAEFLDSFVTALLGSAGVSPAGSTGVPPVPPLDRFKLAGVIATWWTDTLPDFKTLLENGFPGVMDGWVDAIADAVEDDDNARQDFDPFGHKLVRRTMTNGDALVTGANGAKSKLILVTDYSNGNDMIIAKPGIKSLKELKGKKIGLEVTLVEHLLLLKGLEKFGMKPSEVILVNTPTNETPQTLASGQVDAIAAWYPVSGQALRAVPGSTAIWTSKDVPGLIYDTLAVNPVSLAARKDDWTKVVKVWYRIAEYVRDPKTQADAVAIMAKKVGVKPEEYATAIPGTYFLSLAEAQARFKKGEGLDSLYGSTATANKFNLENQVYKESQNPEDYIDGSIILSLK
jgi:hypothetical protein